MQESNVPFVSLDLGSTQPTSVEMETIHVTITAANLLGEYARAFINEGYRVNPLKAQQIQLTEDEVQRYSEYLLTKRIECVENKCRDFRRLKVLYVPSWIQYNLAMVGKVIIRDKGLCLMPAMEKPSTMTFDEAVKISERIGSFEHDLQIVRDALPRSIDGNRDVMSAALIAGYVRSIEKVEHVSSTYVAAFLGMKLREEAAMQVLYRVQYDDVQFIASALTTQKGLY